ncbi:DUF2326 domain-containing protein [Litoribacter populi]|uniref:DUF2326 domain-containing protein n=1 Tax=Litoribacter populi TaxID=2598460 RepID=UPI00117CC30B|nr:DUF2326 domain-containing protein [Litoribacter populi]
MKLSKLYCNKNNFKHVKFNLQGISVVYADVLLGENEASTTNKKNSHSLGKTKLAELIDFLFLKQINPKHSFLLKPGSSGSDPIFKDYVFYLELYLNSGEYLTIRRAVDSATKIAFALHDQTVDGFNPPKTWDCEKVPFEKAKVKLAEYLSLHFFQDKKYDFRKAINYCLRLQGDYEDVYKLSKYVGGYDKDWKPFMFSLLGFNGNLLSEKYDNDAKREDIKKYIEKLKNEFSVKIEDRDDLVAQIQQLELEAQKSENAIDSFNFYEQDKNLISKGIDEVEESISTLNSSSYRLNFEINKLQQSIKNKFAFNLDKVNKVFEESELYFPDQLKNDYEALMDFNKSLTKERNKLLKEALEKKESELQKINERLADLNKEKESLLSHLRDTDSFRRFKLYQKDLVQVQGQLYAIREKLGIIDKIFTLETERETLAREIEGTVWQLKEVYKHTEENQKYSLIRTLFAQFYKQVMDEEVRISWSINSNNNVDFVPPKIQAKGGVKKDTSKDDGRTYKKILCVAFDLAVLCAYNKESYFRFVYHDDVLSQQDNGIKNRLIKLVRELTGQYDFQYILSAIKSDLPVDENEQPIYFPKQETVLLLDKESKGPLFGFEF